eukprot:2192274-Pyramimonas_sp.AAC.1
MNEPPDALFAYRQFAGFQKHVLSIMCSHFTNLVRADLMIDKVCWDIVYAFGVGTRTAISECLQSLPQDGSTSSSPLGIRAGTLSAEA